MLEFPLEIYFAIDAGAALTIDVAAKGEAHIEAVGSLKDDAGGDAHAVAAIGFGFVSDRYAGEVGQLVASATVVAQELVVPSYAGVGLPVGAVVAVESFRLGSQTIA